MAETQIDLKKSDKASTVKELLNKAIGCCDDGDYKGVVVLIDTAKDVIMKSDRMHPNEQAKTVIVEQQMKASSVKQDDTKAENTNCSAAGQFEDIEEAEKSLEIAFIAHAKGNIEKCKRFLRKAQSFGKSIDIDVYMTALDKEKERKEAAERVKVQEEQRRAELQEEQRKAKLQDELRKAKILEEQRKAKLQEEQRKAKLQEEQRNVKIQEEHTKTKLQQRIFAKILEEQRKSKLQHELKAKELEKKAVACYHDGDYETAIRLLDAARCFNPNEQRIQDLIEQVKEAVNQKDIK